MIKYNKDKLKVVMGKLGELCIEFQSLESQLPASDRRVLSSQFTDIYNEMSGMHAYLLGRLQFLIEDDKE